MNTVLFQRAVSREKKATPLKSVVTVAVAVPWLDRYTASLATACLSAPINLTCKHVRNQKPTNTSSSVARRDENDSTRLSAVQTLPSSPPVIKGLTPPGARMCSEGFEAICPLEDEVSVSREPIEWRVQNPKGSSSGE